ncbi:MAG: hypothetical protein QM800_02020 [Paludibacter sp.]
MKVFNPAQKNRFNKRIYYLFITLIISLHAFSQNVGINATGAQPNSAAGLDVDFADKGILIPRVALTSTSSFAPLSAHVAGMIVYNTATTGDISPGFYCDNGSKWVPGFLRGQSVGDMLYWNGTDWLSIPVGVPGQYLQISGSLIPTWGGSVFSTLSTTAASTITATSAVSGGNITSDGGSPVLSRGICWNTVGAPTIGNTKTVDVSGGIGSFAGSLTGLLSGTTYYVRAYAMNSTTINYGNEITFTTSASAPTVAATTAATVITGNTANTGGNVTASGGSPITERGVCYGITTNPTIAGAKLIDPSPGVGSFVSSLSGLSGGTLYYARAYATNSIGTTYGTQISFTTAVVPPTLTTVAVTNISGASAASGGTMAWGGGGYSNYQHYGVCYSTTPVIALPAYIETSSYARIATNSTNGSVNPAVNIAPWVTNLTGLAANTTYYIRSYLNLYKSSPAGWVTVYGPEISFTTSAPTAPIVATTTAATVISANAANTGGTITSDGGSAITAKGVCWGLSSNPVLGVGNFTNNGTGTASYVSNITGLTGNTAYYVRSYATNSVGTSYGPQQTFTTWVQAPYTLGQNLGYGYCAYVAPDGSGFIVSYDIPSTAPWGCSGTSIATSTALGSGQANTTLILATCATRPIAASVADDYTGGGFTDWYLPSALEWGKIGALGTTVGLGSYSNNYYTSSQSSATYVTSWFTNFNAGYQSSASKLAGVNDYIKQLRVIRNFSPAVLPTVTTASITNVAAGSATSGGNVTNDGGAPVLARGVCWSTSANPTIADSKTTDGTGTGGFVSNLSGLASGTLYYVRAYATTVAGTAYGSQVSFTTTAIATAPLVSTDIVISVSGTEASGGGEVISDGGSAVTAYGLCWNTSPSPTTANSKTNDGTGIGVFASSLTGLTPGATYYVRAYATNGINTSYGNEVSFVSGLPTVVADGTAITSVGSLASVYSYVSNDGGDPVTQSGICWSTTTGPTIAGSHSANSIAQVNFYGELSNLTVGTTYYVRAYAANGAGLAYSNEVSFVATAATVGQYIPLVTGYDGYVVSTDGTHGIIASMSEFGVSDWGCATTAAGASGTNVGTGLSNTNAILADITSNSCASSSVNSSYSLFAAQVPSQIMSPDWYLPSKAEVDLLYSTAGATGLTFTGLQIWSSSEVDATHAWYFNGTTWQSGLKTLEKNIWPVRSF